MGFELVTAPEIEPITLDEAKAHIRVTHDAEDALIQLYLRSAVRWVEDWTKRKLISQVWDLTLEDFPQLGTQRIVLPFGKAQSVSWVRYYNSAGSLIELTGQTSSSPAGTDYQEDLSSDYRPFIQPPVDDEWPDVQDERVGAVRVRWTAGYGTSETDVPDPLRTAVLYRFADLYEFRGAFDGGGTKFAKLEAEPYRLIVV